MRVVRLDILIMLVAISLSPSSVTHGISLRPNVKFSIFCNPWKQRQKSFNPVLVKFFPFPHMIWRSLSSVMYLKPELRILRLSSVRLSQRSKSSFKYSSFLKYARLSLRSLIDSPVKTGNKGSLVLTLRCMLRRSKFVRS